MSSVSHRGLTHLGMDVHKDSISVGILAPEDDVPEVEKIFTTRCRYVALLADSLRGARDCPGSNPPARPSGSAQFGHQVEARRVAEHTVVSHKARP